MRGMPSGLTDAQVIARLERLERNLARVAAQVGVALEDPAGGLDPDVVERARSGDRMGAAKLLADRTGVSFVDAQRRVADL
jgi:hypothetical protein